METGYQRGRIQDESMLYEQRKHDGTLPIIGVNTFLADPDRRRARRHAWSWPARTEAEKQSQLRPRSPTSTRRHADDAPAALERLRRPRPAAATCSPC